MLRWRLPGLTDRPAPIAELFDFAPAPARLSDRLAGLEAAYHFRAENLAPELETVREALGVLDLVETALAAARIELPDPLDALDVGARNWFYVRALDALLRFYGGSERNVELTGLEVDPFVVYRDGHSRFDWAQLYAASLPQARYLARDFFSHAGVHDLVLILFPFLNRAEHLDMGLPLSLYRPRDLLAHALAAVRPGGTLVVTCFDYERAALEAIWRALQCEPVIAMPHIPVFVPAQADHFVTVLRR